MLILTIVHADLIDRDNSKYCTNDSEFMPHIGTNYAGNGGALDTKIKPCLDNFAITENVLFAINIFQGDHVLDYTIDIFD